MYDIYKIVESIGVSDELTKLIPEVGAVRSELSICPSDKAGVCVTDILNEIIESQAYRSDYYDITLGLLFVPETYDTVIQSIKRLQTVESGVEVGASGGGRGYFFAERSKSGPIYSKGEQYMEQ